MGRLRTKKAAVRDGCGFHFDFTASNADHSDNPLGTSEESHLLNGWLFYLEALVPTINVAMLCSVAYTCGGLIRRFSFDVLPSS